MYELENERYSPESTPEDFTNYHADQVGYRPAKWDRIFKAITTADDQAPDDRCLVLDYASPHVLQLVGDKDGNPLWATGYQIAMWELKAGHLRWCPAAGSLYRRDTDETVGGMRRLLHSWHIVGDIDHEFGLRPKETNRRIARTIVHEAQRTDWFRQAHRGVRVGNRAWTRDPGQSVRVWDDVAASDIAITQTLPDDGSTPEERGNNEEAAWQVCRTLTMGEGSARNLMRMFCTPFLEPMKQITYILSGDGGNGKSQIVQRLIRKPLGLSKVASFSSADYLTNRSSGFDRGTQMWEMEGKAFAYDDEAPAITSRMLPALRALSTGSPQQARIIGHDPHVAIPTATLVLLTNESFYDSSQTADHRRFVKVQMAPASAHDQGDWATILGFMDRCPSAFYAASAGLWRESDRPDGVQLVPNRISDQQGWLINQLEEARERTGRPLIARQAFRRAFHANLPDDMLSLMGLESIATRRLKPGHILTAITIGDPDRYGQWHAVWAKHLDVPDPKPDDDPRS